MISAERIGVVHDVRGDTIVARLTAEAVPGLAFSRGHAYQVGQVGAFVRIPLGLQDLYAVVVEVGSTLSRDNSDSPEPTVEWAPPGTAWMRLELIAQGDRAGEVRRGVSRYPAVGDPVVLVTAEDLSRILGEPSRPSHVAIGHVAGAPQLKAIVDADGLLTRHAAVVGSTGSGKSTTVCGLLHRLANREQFPGARVVVIDVHGEYANALGDLASVLEVAGADPEVGGTRAALAIPYWALTYDELMAVTFGDLDDASSAAVQAWITAAKRDYVQRHPEVGLEPDDVTVDTPLPFSVRRLWFELYERVAATHTAQQNAQSEQTRAYETDTNGNDLRGDAESVTAPVYKGLVPGQIFMSASPLPIRRQLDRLAGYLRDPRYDFLFKPGVWTPASDGEVEEDLTSFLKQWLGGARPVAVADLSNVPSAVLPDVVGALLRVLYDALVWARQLPEGGRHRPLLVVLEEAHRYLSAETGNAAAVVERVVKEGRKFGVGLMLVSQRPSEIRSTVLSQVGTFFVLRLSNSTDRGLVRSTVPDNLGGLFDSVPALRTGEAIVTGEATRLPTRVLLTIPETDRPDSRDPSVVGDDNKPGWTRLVAAEDYGKVVSNWRKTNTKAAQTP